MRRCLYLGLLFSVITLYTAAPVSAQGPLFSSGLKLGMTAGSYDFDPDPAVDGHTMHKGFAAGLVIDIRSSIKWQASFEFLFLTSGDEFDHIDLGNTSQVIPAKYKAKFITIPFLIRYYFSLDKVKPYLCAGPEISYLMTFDRDPEPEGGSSNNEIDYVDRASTAVVGGIGVEYKLDYSPLSYFAELRYSYGIQDLMDDYQSLRLLDHPVMKQRVFLLSAGVKF